MTSDLVEQKHKFEDSKTKLQRAERVLRDVTNQRDVMKRSRDFAKTKLSKCEGKYESLQEEYARV